MSIARQLLPSPPALTPDPSLDANERKHFEMLLAAARTTHTYPNGKFSGRGIVTCCGGPKYNTQAYVLFRRIRASKCTLPIQAWYLGENEYDETFVNACHGLNIEFVNGRSLLEEYPHPRLGGWELKNYAILHSRFEEVIFLDADNVPLIDVAQFFTWDGYKEHGCIFWPDRGRLKSDHKAWKRTGVPYRDEPEWETGQMVIDKRRCWHALHVSQHLNEQSSYWYRVWYGDKECFHFGWLAAGKSFAMTPHKVRDMNWHAMYQMDFDGNVVLQHRNGKKWRLDGDNPPVRDFQFERECISYLEDLKRKLKSAAPSPIPKPAKCIYIYDWHGNHDRWLTGLLEFYAKRSTEVRWVRGSIPHGMFGFINKIDDAQHVFIWNGGEPGCEVVRQVCDSAKVPWSVVEVGWFDRSNHVHFDSNGINAASSIMSDQLGWLTQEMVDKLPEARKRFARGFKYSGKNEYVLCPLQLDIDTNIYRNSPYRMHEFIEHCKTVFNGHRIVVRPHPQNRGFQAKGIEVVADGSFFFRSQDASLVYGINSNSLLESALIGVPTAAIGYGLYQAHSHQIEKLLAAVVQIQTPNTNANLEWHLERAGVCL